MGVEEDLGWQMLQTRGILEQEVEAHSLAGKPVTAHVITAPIGMLDVSSVFQYPEKGDPLRKGDFFGYFQMGGSNNVLVFDKHIKLVEAYIQPLQKVKTGQAIFKVEYTDAPEDVVHNPKAFFSAPKAHRPLLKQLDK